MSLRVGRGIPEAVPYDADGDAGSACRGPRYILDISVESCSISSTLSGRASPRSLMRPGCMACQQEWWDLDHLDELCIYHSNTLIVTMCRVCGQPSMAEKPGICPDCDATIIALLEGQE